MRRETFRKARFKDENEKQSNLVNPNLLVYSSLKAGLCNHNHTK